MTILNIITGKWLCGCAGASSGEKNAANGMSSLFTNMMSQAQTVFGASSKVFNDLYSSMSPIVAAGPGQNGMTPAQLAAANSQVITQTGQQSDNARRVAASRVAAAGGGNIALPSGVGVGTELAAAESGAERTSEGLLNVAQQNRELGFRKWEEASRSLAGAPNVFNPATSAGSAAGSIGDASFGEQKTIAAEDRAASPWRAVAGALGGIAGKVAGAAVPSIGTAIGDRVGGFINPDDSVV